MPISRRFGFMVCASVCLVLTAGWLSVAAEQNDKPANKAANKNVKKNAKAKASRPAKNAAQSHPDDDVDYKKYAIYRATAPRAGAATPVETTLPLIVNKGDRIAFIGNTLFDRAQHFGNFETLLHQRFPHHNLIVRNLAWSGDTPTIQPRPANFADTEQHLTHEKVDVIFAAFGFNESFEGEAGEKGFRDSLSKYVGTLKTKAFNGKTGPRIVLLSPIANEDVKGVPAGTQNNARLKRYAAIVQAVAKEHKVGFADVFTATAESMLDDKDDLTINGVHLTGEGYELFARTLHQQVIGDVAPSLNEALRKEVLDKNRQYSRRFRPINTFYYTGGRNRSYGYLDFLPAMRNFDMMVANREKRIAAIAMGKSVAPKVDDSNVPPLPKTKESRGANQWMSAKDEFKAFKIDPRFEVTLFAGEEEFPDIAAPIQMRWDTKGRLWVSCSTTYPHVYPGNEPNDKLVILEDTDGDGKADKSTVFADDLNIPLSFEFGDGGVYVSEMPHMTFLKDTDGDGKADSRRIVLTGFGTEDSHHSLHDMTWTPDGDLIWRESIFHHSQVETPYGPVRQQNSGWFRFQPRTQHLISFGTYHSTNPWGVTFDDWGFHIASHPIFAAAFHSLDPPYPQQHPKPSGLQAYSGTAGHEFIDFNTFPKDLQGHFVKVRYKPTNRVEILKWNETPNGYDEKYVGDLIFSSNLSFIPVDLQYGPRGALYICDWYNPVKGHAQYSLRDERRDRHSGRIWRIKAKGIPLQEPAKIDGASIPALIELLKRPEYRVRYWAKRELRERPAGEVKQVLDRWVKQLKADDTRYRHHQLEAIWTYRTIGAENVALLRELLGCEVHHARAAATQQLRYWHPHLSDATELLRRSANDANGLVRMEAAIAASYIGTQDALDAMLDVAKHPRDKHLAYAFTCALGSHTLQRHWKGNPKYAHVPQILKGTAEASEFVEKDRTAIQSQFDSQKNLKSVRIGCIPERMKFSVDRVDVKPGQPVKIVFFNPDATDHNLVLVKPGALEEVGMAANDMAKDPKNANSDFIPMDKKNLILTYSPMIGPTKASKVHVMRFTAPKEPGIYPYVCTFPGHWVVMYGEMIVAGSQKEADALLASRDTPTFVKNWTMDDFGKEVEDLKGRNVMRGMKAFMTARCNQCHAVGGHGAKIGPDLSEVSKQFKGTKLLQQILEPSVVINEKYKGVQLVMKNGERVSGVIAKEDKKAISIIPNLLNPNAVIKVPTRQVKSRVVSKLSSMPQGMTAVLTKEQILDMLAFLEAGGFQLPDNLKHKHQH